MKTLKDNFEIKNLWNTLVDNFKLALVYFCVLGGYILYKNTINCQ